MVLKVFLVDDEQKSRDTLRNMIHEFCSDVEVIGESWMVEDAAKQIAKLQPDVVFLDIEMPEQNGFELFNYFPEPTFSVIFATAYNQYAAQAFSLSAIHYLLKPFSVKVLKEALNRARKNKEDQQAFQEKLKALEANLQGKAKKLVIPVHNGLKFIKLDSILRCQADRGYALFVLNNGEKVMASKPLGHFEKILEGTSFFRVHRSDIINLDYLKSYEKSRQGIVTLANGDEVVVSRNRREAFLEKVQAL